jgi:DNA-binding SARP family transcriptional activator
MRRDLGAEDVFAGTNELRLNPELLPSDVEEFRAALLAGRLEDAVARYAGPFLDGFYLSDAPEFERWTEQERSALGHDYARAVETLAQRASARNDPKSAAGWWRKLAATDPLDSRVALELMRALDAANDRAGAIRHAQVFEELLRQELGMAPDPAVSELARELAAGATGAQTRVAGRDAAPPRAEQDVPATRPAQRETGAVPLATRNPQPAPRTRVLAAAILLLSVAAVTLVASRRRPAQANAAQSAWVAVLPFTVRGSASLGYLSEGMVDLLSATLDGAGAYNSVDPHTVIRVARQLGGGDPPLDGGRVAARLRATHYVLGDVIEAGGTLRISAALYGPDAGAAPIARGSVEGSADELFTLVDRLSEELLTPRTGGPRARLVGLAAATTQSLAALKAYLEGEHLFRQLTLPRAAEAYQRAVALDSTFALAWYRLAVVATWTLRTRSASLFAERAATYAHKLGPRERQLLTAFHADLRGKADSAELQYRNLLTGNGDDVEAWLGLGEVLFHQSWNRGRSMLESREPWERVIALDSTNWQARVHLAQVLAKVPDTAALARTLGVVLTGNTDSTRVLWLSSLSTVASGDTAAKERLVSGLRRADPYWITVSVLNVGVYLEEIDAAIELARLLTQSHHPPGTRGFGHTVLAHLELARGRWDAAQAELALADAQTEGWSSDFAPYLATASFLETPAGELEILREALGEPPGAELLTGAPRPWNDAHVGARVHIRAYLRGVLSAQRGDANGAHSAAVSVESAQVTEPLASMTRDLARGIRARIAAREGREDDAVAELERLELSAAFESGWASPFLSLAPERYLLAELYLRRNRLDEALAWYRSLGENSFFDLPFLAPSHLRRGEIYERLGDRARALDEYRQMVRLWRDCDPQLRPLRAQAESRIAALAAQRH